MTHVASTGRGGQRERCEEQYGQHNGTTSTATTSYHHVTSFRDPTSGPWAARRQRPRRRWHHGAVPATPRRNGGPASVLTSTVLHGTGHGRRVPGGGRVWVSAATQLSSGAARAAVRRRVGTRTREHRLQHHGTDVCRRRPARCLSRRAIPTPPGSRVRLTHIETIERTDIEAARSMLPVRWSSHSTGHDVATSLRFRCG